MEIFTIDQASAEVFGEMLPDSFETEDIITLGATEDGLALGVLQFYIDNSDNAIIIHLFVDPSARRRYVGAQLLLKLYEIGGEAGVKRVACLCSDKDDEPGLTRFLLKTGFEPRPTDGIFKAPLSFWLDYSMVTLPEDPDLIQFFSSIPRRSRTLLMLDLFSISQPLDVGVAGKTPVEDHLSCFFEKDGAKGCILFGLHVHQVVEVLRLGVKGKAPGPVLLQLIQTAMSKAEETYSPDTLFLIRCKEEKERRLIEKLWPKAGYYERYAYVRELDGR